jgi:hypothetical protein
MTNLSPAAQAVLADGRQYATQAWSEATHQRFNLGIAAALRAAADQVVPLTHAEPYFDDFECGAWVARTDARYELLAIADELEANEPNL